MGQLIDLQERRARRAQPRPAERPAFFFDISGPLSYLMAERVERVLGDVEWVPVDAGLLRRSGATPPGARAHSRAGQPGEDAGLRALAEACAGSLRLPLVWPDRYPAPAPCAQRACAFACEIGAGGAFALAASRLAFCGGFDLEDPETLAEAAAAAGVPLEECLEAAGESWRDEEMEAVAGELRRQGVTELPAFWIGGRWLEGSSCLLAPGAALQASAAPGRSLAPIA